MKYLSRLALTCLLFLTSTAVSALDQHSAVGRLLIYMMKYPERLEQRRNKPETQEQYYKAVDTQYDHFLVHKDPADLKFTLHEEWKKTWWDQNPGWSDLIWYGIPCATLIIIGFIIDSTNPAHQGYYAPRPQPQDENFGDDAYRLDNNPPAYVPEDN